MSNLPSSWLELMQWLRAARAEASAASKRDPAHLGYRGERMAYEAALKKVRSMRSELSNPNPR